MPNSAEVIERLARNLERERLLSVAKEAKDKQEIIDYLEALLSAKD